MVIPASWRDNYIVLSLNQRRHPMRLNRFVFGPIMLMMLTMGGCLYVGSILIHSLDPFPIYEFVDKSGPVAARNMSSWDFTVDPAVVRSVSMKYASSIDSYSSGRNSNSDILTRKRLLLCFTIAGRLLTPTFNARKNANKRGGPLIRSPSVHQLPIHPVGGRHQPPLVTQLRICFVS